MNIFLTFAFLFFIGSVSGWVAELFFRRFISDENPERKWINPGFCTGPYLPLYGCGLCLLYLIASLEVYSIIENPFWNKLALFLTMAVSMTIIEYVAGVLSLKILRMRLWDYRNEWRNVQGIICPKFSLIWASLGAMYYFLIHPHILDALNWLAQNLAFSFVIGLFFGVFIIDAVNSVELGVKLKRFAEENEVVVRYEEMKLHIRKLYDNNKKKYKFFRPFKGEKPVHEYLKELYESFEKQKAKRKK